jgi:hypothetical protein
LGPQKSGHCREVVAIQWVINEFTNNFSSLENE